MAPLSGKTNSFRRIVLGLRLFRDKVLPQHKSYQFEQLGPVHLHNIVGS